VSARIFCNVASILSSRFSARTFIFGALLLLGAGPALAGGEYHVVVQGAPAIPQDIHIVADGSNESGWLDGGVLTLGPLAQGDFFQIGEHVTVAVEVESAGVYGVDGTPVPAGSYVAPSEVFGPMTFSVEENETFFIIVNGQIVNSNRPDFPAGTTLPFMLTFPAEQGRQIQTPVFWFSDGSGGWFPFLNEGPMSTLLSVQ